MKKHYIVYAESMADAVNKVKKMRKAEDRRITDDNFYGIPGIEFVWHGSNRDPELVYEGTSINYYDLEDALWEAFNDEMNEQGKKADESKFNAWVLKNKDLAYDFADNLVDMAKRKTRDSRRLMRKSVSKRPTIRKDSVVRKPVRHISHLKKKIA